MNNLSLALKLKQIIKVVSGNLQNNDNELEDIDINVISTDTREDIRGGLYIALEGENFDGHDFINLAIKKGVAAVISHKKIDCGGFKNLILVRDTKQALMDIAGYYRLLFDVKFVGVTGSVGKTTTKDMIASVLEQRYHVLKTQENLNNEIGVSKTILSLKPDHEVVVIEMGMSGLGEIAKLSNVVKPDIGVITNIGISHMELLGSRENIFKAKLEITEGMKCGSTLLLNGDDDLLARYDNKTYDIKFVCIAENNTDKKANIFARNISCNFDDVEFDICDQEKESIEIRAKLPCIGTHNIYSALIAYVVGRELKVEIDDIIRGINLYKPSGMRQRIVKFNGASVVEDCYNASPDSMKAAIKALSNTKTSGRTILVISDMLELGEQSKQYHYEIGRLVSESGVDRLYCIGNLAKQYCEGALAGGMKLEQVCFFESKQKLAEDLNKFIKDDDVVWVKASRGMKLEEMLNFMYLM